MCSTVYFLMATGVICSDLTTFPLIYFHSASICCSPLPFLICSFQSQNHWLSSANGLFTSHPALFSLLVHFSTHFLTTEMFYWWKTYYFASSSSLRLFFSFSYSVFFLSDALRGFHHVSMHKSIFLFQCLIFLPPLLQTIVIRDQISF